VTFDVPTVKFLKIHFCVVVLSYWICCSSDFSGVCCQVGAAVGVLDTDFEGIVVLQYVGNYMPIGRHNIYLRRTESLHTVEVFLC
jgi:hypothetical protein